MKKWICKIFGHKMRYKYKPIVEWIHTMNVSNGHPILYTSCLTQYCGRCGIKFIG